MTIYNHEIIDTAVSHALGLHRKFNTSLRYTVALNQKPNGWRHSSVVENLLSMYEVVGLTPHIQNQTKPRIPTEETISIMHEELHTG